MCWDVSLHSDIEIIKEAFPGLRDERRILEYDLSRMENVQAITFPEYPIIYRDVETGALALTDMEWGVLPTFIQDPKEQEDRRRTMVNIKSERVLEDHKSYWHRLKDQRCLIPVSGTFEHRRINGWKNKIPYYIAEKGRELFYIPGLYQWHESIDQDGVVEKVGSFGMMTRTANDVMQNIHNDGPHKHRMPLFLNETLEKAWLSGIKEIDMAQIFEYEISPENMEYFPVYTLRGFPKRPDGKHRYEPYHWRGLPPLGRDGPNDIQGTLF